MGTEDGSRRQRSEVRRYPVENMLELMAAGMKIEELLTDYPDLEREDFLVCLEYATKLVQLKSIHKIAS